MTPCRVKYLHAGTVKFLLILFVMMQSFMVLSLFWPDAVFSPVWAGTASEPLTDDIEQHFRYGHEFYMMRKYREAQVEFENVKVMAPGSVLGYIWSGKSLARLGEYDSALVEFNRGLAIDPSNGELKSMVEKYGPKASISVEPEPAETNPLLSQPAVDQGQRGIEFRFVKAQEPSDDELTPRVKLPGMPDNHENSEVEVILGDTTYGAEEADSGEASGATSESSATADASAKEAARARATAGLTLAELEAACRENVKSLKDAVFSYNLDHLDEMNSETFSLSKLKEGGYLKEIPVCPENGTYELSKGEARCSFHDED
ncbi:MAG: hypothetical protein CVV64_02480 [Candidatus Wallbacteria bacterium HGW-Wallbacteria-1]|jgi:tetratricopeptide (TPR) repeat protein|uniref:Uncharacterized protein n=1 Tax=Candidatus Wallbacteria bacterium HGW-Wallbacteria-1 TaxID=2013854 RepID=A0A2N1PVD7_9BACT|nr:MAG: hypothetical protein CVV64_02480 [Candidatus Wallbacteria bacterium HGW-Wallbacteria-1]